MFYTIIITDTQAIFGYATQAAATEKFHTELAYAYNQALSVTCIVIDSHGAVYKSEEYRAPNDVATED
jgi:hypothetical protein